MLLYVVVCVRTVGSVHNELEPKWWLMGRWVGYHVRQRHGEGVAIYSGKLGDLVSRLIRGSQPMM